MKNIIPSLIAALDTARHLRLHEIAFDGAILRFILSDLSGPAPKAQDQAVEDWLKKHGTG